jgi:predicted enzyme related to lactoylglutathione lyase
LGTRAFLAKFIMEGPERDIFRHRHIFEVDMVIARIIAWIKKARSVPLFLGFEHSGLYPLKTDAETIAAWYEKTFGFHKTEEGASYLLSGSGKGRLEIMKHATGNNHVHIAIHVSDFERAVAALRAKGVLLKEPMIQPNLKIVYLREPDPEGNPVHLWWGR